MHIASAIRLGASGDDKYELYSLLCLQDLAGDLAQSSVSFRIPFLPFTLLS